MLETDEQDTASCNDFGKNILPTLVAQGERVFAYPFSGYWKDVGTVRSLWEANMDLLGEHPALDLCDGGHRIYSRSEARPPVYLGEGAQICNALLSDGCRVRGRVEHSILSGGVLVERGAVVRHSVLMEDVVVRAGARVEYAIVDSGAQIGRGACVGDAHDANETITVIRAGQTVPPVLLAEGLPRTGTD